ncbi:amino acid ABC transporter substrate-binding protein [Paracoccus aminophilus]|uniref:Glutamate/glutamine/aspartate/asparagine-binding protein n=1 Tax=Paracoccus aminophilus JCM 7686 TaxID=1367847 RepID=S5YZL9_PARAH|nr:amino acid ABC transporter substrate-binding protein [Paracoccus aminophilus]AGT10656.1 glutamate/glutamine/aspartate/asparagine-binding protein [Paracoccus aminophilus JCM 7686]
MIKGSWFAALGLALPFMSALPAHAGPTLDAVKQRGELKCGVNTGSAGFAAPDKNGVWRGMDVDFCRVIAAAVLGDASKVQFVPVSPETRFPTLQAGEIDVLIRQTSTTLSRDSSLGLLFEPPIFYDGQGVLVSAASGITSAKELDGASICVQPGSTTELNVQDYFQKNGMEFKPVVIESLDQVTNTFFAGRCDALTSDRSDLASARSIAVNRDDYVLLPEVLSKEPLAPVVRQGDDQWFLIVKWAIYATFVGEEKQLGRETIDAAATSSTDPEVARFLGKDPGVFAGLGLKPDWAYQIIKQVGNYGEIYNANVGPSTALGLERGLNRMWTEGGLLYAPPFR